MAGVVPRLAAGQSPPPAWRQCVDSIPDRDLARVAAYLASDADRTAPSVAKASDLLLEIVAQKIRALLGAAPGQLPMGEPTITRRTSGGSVEITLRRDGQFSRRIAPDSLPDSSRSAGARLIARAVDAVISEGERVFWPEKGVGDSATFKVFFVAPWPRRDGTPVEPSVRFASVVFSLALPWIEPPSVKKLSKPVYPQNSLRGFSEGFVIMEFTVDEHGRVDRSTIRDLWPPDQPTLMGALADYYRAFVNAAKSSIAETEYNPASAAGCLFPQQVKQPFDFKFNRH